MAIAMVGASADELERVAGQLRVAADELDAHASSLTATLRSVSWVGGVATRFSSRWDSTHRARLRSTADAVRAASVRLARHAAEQRDASRAAPSIGFDPPPDLDRPSAAGHDEVVVRLEAYFDDLGLGRDVARGLVTGASRLADLGHVHELLDLLTGDVVGGVLDGLDLVLDHRDVVVDLVRDFVEQPLLALDERIVHAVADASVRLGLDQGMEFAAEWAGATMTAMLLPGVGGVLAPIVGAVAGEVAGGLMDVAVEAIDAATDVVDLVADGAVEAYRSAKRDLGLVVEAAGLLVDAGEAVLDVGGDLVDGVVDVVTGGVADFVGDFFGD